MISPLLQLALIVGLGIAAQWLAWRVGVPSILFLLIAGWTAGPIFGWIRPDMLMGDLLMPVVSLSVGLILFEGGMSLHFREIKQMGTVTWRLVSIGALVTFALVTLLSHYLLEFGWPVSLLIGAILVVTGPTVIGPMIRHIRPSPQAASVLKWEGIVIDPIGALLAVLVYECTVNLDTLGGPGIAVGMFQTVLVGVLLGLAGAYILVFSMERFWIPDYLQSSAVLATVLIIFAGSNTLKDEAGLIATTIMGIIIANQQRAVVKHVLAFKENLRVLLLSVLFILLSARLTYDYVNNINLRAVIFVTLLILLVRPLSVFASTLGTNMHWRERMLLAWVAPRGIVAAAISSVFAYEMAHAGVTDAEDMVPIIFFVIAATVAIYGLTSAPVARWLKVTQPDPRGVLLVGAHRFARELGKALKDVGVDSLLIDRNNENVRAAKLLGLNARYGDILDHNWLEETVALGLGKILALTPNDKLNALAALHFSEVLEQRNIYQLPQPKGAEAKSRDAELPRHFMGRTLFGAGLTYHQIDQKLDAGYKIKSTLLTPAFTYEEYQANWGGQAIPLISFKDGSPTLSIVTPDASKPAPGARLIALVPPTPDKPEPAPPQK